MGDDREGLIRHYQAQREALIAVLHNLSDEVMIEPSLDGWSVKTHLVHMATWDEIRASEVERISAGHDSAWRLTVDQEPVFSALATELRRDLSLEQARWELETSRKKLLEAISSATPRGLDPSLYGEAGLRSLHEAQHTAWIRRWRDEKGR